jgi:hypothetical protein
VAPDSLNFRRGTPIWDICRGKYLYLREKVKQESGEIA